MGFTRVEFLLFLITVVTIVWSTRRVTIRNTVLLIASYYFYAYWDWRFCGLLLLSTIVDFNCAKRIHKSENQKSRRNWLLVSLVVNLGVLATFKYCNFFIDTARPLLQSMGLSGQTLNVILPVGISFYTFQTLSYTIDVFRGRLKPTDRWLNFSLYVAFFPQLVAGPIVRARELLPQLENQPAFSKRRFYGGFQQLLRGAVKKILIADRMGEVADVVFAGPDLYGSLTVWIAVIAYTGQIYYDFSGYTDMATGAAKLLGYRFPVNFRHPYLAIGVADFWHRWHMTLSRWLRDYLYIPLGGGRQGSLATYRNLMITMTLGGLWHGAAWTFVLWGVWHGIALCVQRLFASAFRLPALLSWLGTLLIVVLGWVVFRSPDIDTAGQIIGKMLGAGDGISWYPPLAVLAIVLMVVDHAVWRTRWRQAMRLPFGKWYSPIATAVMVWCLLLYSPQGFRPFVYFQF